MATPIKSMTVRKILFTVSSSERKTNAKKNPKLLRDGSVAFPDSAPTLSWGTGLWQPVLSAR